MILSVATSDESYGSIQSTALHSLGFGGYGMRFEHL
jgi:hypothetical protein